MKLLDCFLAIADTGASVDCSGVEILRTLGIGMKTVLGLIPVIVSTLSVDKEAIIEEYTFFFFIRTKFIKTSSLTLVQNLRLKFQKAKNY